MTPPSIIQGGMGAGVSSWPLAKAVSEQGQLGVVSGTALDSIMARRLQLGDVGGHIKYALSFFPNKQIAECVYEKYYVRAGKHNGKFKLIPKWTINPSKALFELAVVANFVEVFLAKEGHEGIVGINYLEKIQMPNLASIYGAMLAGVDYILMGAGIPWEIPDVIKKYVHHEEAFLSMDVIGLETGEKILMRFNPQDVVGEIAKSLKLPKFLPIVSSFVLAKKLTGRADGFVIEGPIAGGHNALPRGLLQLDKNGEPVYGEKDEVDLDKIAGLGLPFWLAGGFGSPAGLQKALSLGASGIQVGTPFALCQESGLGIDYKQAILQKITAEELVVLTDHRASPTGFPFKVVQLEQTLSEREAYEKRPRICDLGYLRSLQKKQGTIGYICPAEIKTSFLAKGGTTPETQGRKCLCNALMANIGLGQNQHVGGEERPLITLGSNVEVVRPIIEQYGLSYTASDVINFILDE
ncbi:2-nitropropane dioxygenase [Candidatus Falkowbacteria bacterium CG10_big_fil_rev_8_21_14_0_10_37_6]|uniref:2-nitropropane dioxygenase n=1 Tax=Candidatus Falkowbacteria bacterium CG10_big_fil_rev_8_21_14_0_10_37_6 TaxID=1974563 RepID=A0A2H0V8P4_9BACT|nr:MAG: 2-nitropropane dioxygenase [Candidatus Falkowbacteria bacterium CG10_big_fil_rev_8_21_14_0_10_37_6]